MQSISQRPAPHQGRNESAAIAITAQLLSGLKTRTGDTLTLYPSAGAPRYGWDAGSLFAYARGSDSYFGRTHNSPYGTTWFGRDVLLDQHGRKWTRDWGAVVDDFGTLVEVAS